ncbi:MAG TPA: response regulator [Puia sp.]|nr:response regulator [Puia sp.]
MKQINRVLVIDDDKDDQQFLHKAIHDLFPNMECISLNNGKEALKFIEENPPPPSYIFLDLNMPYLNGFEFLKEFKKEKGNSETSVYIYSTSSNPRDKEKAKSLGADDYIVKFTDLTSLKARLKNVIQT